MVHINAAMKQLLSAPLVDTSYQRDVLKVGSKALASMPSASNGATIPWSFHQHAPQALRVLSVKYQV